MASDLTMRLMVGAALAGSFSNVFSKAGSALEGLQGKLSALDKSQAQLEKFGKLQGVMAQTSDKLNAARGRVRELGEQMRATASPSEQLKKQFTAAHLEANKLQNKLGDQRKALGHLRESLKGAGIDTRNFSDEQAKLTQNTEKIQQAQERVARAQGNLDASKQSLSNMKGDVLASAGILLALRAPLNVAADFEQAMAKVGAVSGATGEDFVKLSAQARQLGKDTQFTAMQAANSQENLARAGFKTEEIIQAMPGLLNMAAAENMDLATAADIAASTLRGYQMAADQSNRVADVLAKTSAASNTSISTLGESMKMVAPIAAGLKIPFEEATAMIGVMGDAGIKGSEAGTALRAALVRLSKEPAQTAKALEKLGVATRDTNGNLRTMPSLMASLSEKMAGMGNADKMGELSKIFGTEAASGMLAIMDAAKSGRLNELTGELQNAGGAAAAMAKRMNDTAQGAMKRLSSAAESLMIDIGNVLLPVFSEGVEILSRFTGKMSEFAQKFPLVTKVLVGGVAALGAYKIAATGVKIAMTLVKLPFQHAALLLAKLNASMVLNGQTSIWMAAKTKIAAFATKAWSIAQGALNLVIGAGQKLLSVAKLVAYKSAQFAITAASKAWAAAQWLLNTAMSAGQTLFSVAKLVAYKAAQFAIAAATKAWTAVQWLLNAAMNANPISLAVIAIGALVAAFMLAYNKCEWFRDMVNSAWEMMKTGAAVWRDALVGALDWVLEKWDAIVGGFRAGSDVLGGIINSIREKFAAGFEKITAMIEKVGNMWDKFKSALGIAPKIPVPKGQPVAMSSAPGAVEALAQRHAAGGIFSRPHLGMVAEAGTESIIPHNPSGERIWQVTGEQAGFSMGAPGGVSFSPTISVTVQAGAGSDGNTIGRQIVSVMESELPRMLRRFNEQQARLAY